MANPLDLVAFAKRAWEEAQSEYDKTSQPLNERATILPFGQYEDGSVGLAWPGILAAPAEGMVNFGRYGYDSPEAIRDNALSAFDVAGGAVTGGLGVGLAGGLVDNAVGSAGGKLARGASELPMDIASRMARAREMGFDTDKTWYHGTDREFPAFEETVGASGARGVYLTDNPEVASFYAQARGGENAQILPVNIKAFGPFADYFQTADGTRNIAVPPNSIRSVNAAFDPSKSDSANLLAANAKSGAAVPLLQNALERAQPRGIRAYHGSPHDFDRFSLDRIGTGEGAQAYGHGLYFAGDEGVAKYYRDALTQNLGGDGTAQGFWSGKAMQEAGYDADKARTILQKRIDDYEAGKRPFGVPDKDAEYRSALERGLSELAPKGRMYEVNIRANPEDFLDWDKPLSQQSEAARNALQNVMPEADDLQVMELLGKLRKEEGLKAGNLFSEASARAATNRLREAGIPGIRYLDGMSRGAGEGSSNYVVFSDDIIDILRKYSNAPTAAALPLAAETQDQDNPLFSYLRMIGL